MAVPALPPAKSILEVVGSRNPSSYESLMHETIEGAGIMLPKYLCELNFIEFFWGSNEETPLRILWLHLLWPPLMCLPFRSGNIGWYNGWMLTKKETRRPRFRSRSLAATNSLHIVEYMSRLLQYLIRLFRYTVNNGSLKHYGSMKQFDFSQSVSHLLAWTKLQQRAI